MTKILHIYYGSETNYAKVDLVKFSCIHNMADIKYKVLVLYALIYYNDNKNSFGSFKGMINFFIGKFQEI